jgi:hypothetical protein
MENTNDKMFQRDNVHKEMFGFCIAAPNLKHPYMFLDILENAKHVVPNCCPNLSQH